MNLWLLTYNLIFFLNMIFSINASLYLTYSGILRTPQAPKERVLNVSSSRYCYYRTSLFRKPHRKTLFPFCTPLLLLFLSSWRLMPESALFFVSCTDTSKLNRCSTLECQNQFASQFVHLWIPFYYTIKNMNRRKHA